ncbi:MAG: PilZ domain-containing protein [Gemmatimonadales bacterium]
MSPQFDRAFYRLVYPLAFRPVLRLDRLRCEVVDLSEQGIRFLHPGPALLTVREEFKGFLELPTDLGMEVEGMVVRVDGRQIAASLSKGVPFGVMLEQQRFLQQRLVGWR